MAGDIILNNGTIITAEEVAEIASEVKKLIAKEAKEPSQYEEVNSLANLTTLPALLQNGSVYKLVRAKVELLKGKDAKELEMRLSETAIQWRRDGDDVWQDLITVEKIQEPANVAIAAAEKAAEDAIAAETARQSAWAAWFEHATTGVKAIWNSWFGTTKSDWNSFNTAANQAESNRATEYASLREDIVAKTEAADEAADRVDESILDVSKEKELAIAAAKNANEKIGEMNMGLARLEELEATLTAKDRQQPTSMVLTYPKRITFGNLTEQRIKATLSPAGTGSNVLFLSDNQSVSVAPDGRISVLQTGRSFVHVIPTENTGIYQTVEINVNEPTLRLVSATSLRVDSDGNFRLN